MPSAVSLSWDSATPNSNIPPLDTLDRLNSGKRYVCSSGRVMLPQLKKCIALRLRRGGDLGMLCHLPGLRVHAIRVRVGERLGIRIYRVQRVQGFRLTV